METQTRNAAGRRFVTASMAVITVVTHVVLFMTLKSAMEEDGVAAQCVPLVAAYYGVFVVSVLFELARRRPIPWSAA